MLDNFRKISFLKKYFYFWACGHQIYFRLPNLSFELGHLKWLSSWMSYSFDNCLRMFQSTTDCRNSVTIRILKRNSFLEMVMKNLTIFTLRSPAAYFLASFLSEKPCTLRYSQLTRLVPVNASGIFSFSQILSFTSNPEPMGWLELTLYSIQFSSHLNPISRFEYIFKFQVSQFVTSTLILWITCDWHCTYNIWHLCL